MIIDSHAHLVAPPSLYAHRSNLIVSGGQYGDPFRANVGDADLEKSAAQNVAIMDGVGTDLQVLSPRPFMLLHGLARWEDIVSWTWDNNDLVARTVKLHPRRFRGAGALPQALGRPIETVFDEIKRCVEELGFVGVLLNPDPSEGRGSSPPLGDPYWFPLFERLCELDLPAHIHSGQCCGRETYDEHFITEESLAITSLISRRRSTSRFPDSTDGESWWRGCNSVPGQALALQSTDGNRSGTVAQGHRELRCDAAPLLVRHGVAQPAIVGVAVRCGRCRTLPVRY